MRYQTKFEIARQACSLASLSPVGNLLTDTSERAVICRELMDDVVDLCLSTLSYEATRVSMPLTKVTGVDGYQLPPHYVKLVGITECCTCCCDCLENLKIDYDVQFRILNGSLFIDAPHACCCGDPVRHLIYTSLDHSNADIPVNLKHAMTHLLAYHLAKRTGESSDYGNLFDMHRVYINLAKTANESDSRITSHAQGDGHLPPYHGTGHGRLY